MMSVADKIVLRKRALVVPVNDEQNNIAQIELILVTFLLIIPNNSA